MYRVCRWIQEFAIAEMAGDASVAADAVRLSESDLDQLFQESVTVVPHDEAMRTVLALRELGMRGPSMEPAEFMEVMTTAHFTDYFGTALSRAFLSDYTSMSSDWMSYVKHDVVPDFRDVERFRMTKPGGLDQRAEKARAKTTYRSVSKLEYGVDEFAREFDVSWRTIMNDDLGKIRETPRDMANAATDWLSSFVSNLYDNATSQAGLIALGAVYAGTGRLTAANLAVGLNAMMQRTDANGTPITIKKVWVVIPPILQIQAASILRDLLSYGGAGGNVLSDFVAGVKVDPYITFAGINVPWYLVADPSEIGGITVARLQGWPGPIVYMKQSDIKMVQGTAPGAFTMGDYDTGNILWTVEDVVGGWDDATYAGVTDFRGVYYSTGTTP